MPQIARVLSRESFIYFFSSSLSLHVRYITRVLQLKAGKYPDDNFVISFVGLLQTLEQALFLSIYLCAEYLDILSETNVMRTLQMFSLSDHFLHIR